MTPEDVLEVFRGWHSVCGEDPDELVCGDTPHLSALPDWS